jgi:diguanylate cyclase
MNPVPAIGDEPQATIGSVEELRRQAERLRQRAERERKARIVAEEILEAKSRELFLLNQTLEQRVAERTAQLEIAKERAIALAEIDQLTGLANRASLHLRLAEIETRNPCANEPFALLAIDLDRFKEVNDTLGHAAGDFLLREIARRFRAVLPDETFIARLGGDEFAALCFGAQNIGTLYETCKTLVAEVARPSFYHGCELRVSASIGVALYPQDAETGPELLRCADLALYETKRMGKNGATKFDKEMRRLQEEARNLTHELRSAIEQRQIEVWYQPKFNLVTRRPTGVEALARWRHPVHGFVSPTIFVALAEEQGLIDALERHVLLVACETATRWIAAGYMTHIAVNLSPRHLEKLDFLQDVDDALAQSGLAPSALELEITENHFATANADSLPKLAALVARGVAISLDDFGVGYSNLSYLLKIPLKTLKIDRSFTEGVDRSADARTIVDAIVRLAKAFNLHTIVEGIETESQLNAVRLLNCEDGQGYLYAAPMPRGMCELFLAEKIAQADASACGDPDTRRVEAAE